MKKKKKEISRFGHSDKLIGSGFKRIGLEWLSMKYVQHISYVYIIDAYSISRNKTKVLYFEPALALFSQ